MCRRSITFSAVTGQSRATSGALAKIKWDKDRGKEPTRRVSFRTAAASHRRAKPQNAAPAARNRETTCQCAFGARGQPAGQDCMMDSGG
jgi:hypothetical protein